MNKIIAVNKNQKEPKHLYEMFCADTTKIYHDYKKQNLKQMVSKVTNILNMLHLKTIDPLLNDLLDNTKAHFSSIVESDSGKTKYFIKIILKEDILMQKMILNNQTLGKILKNNRDIELRRYTPTLVDSDTHFLLYEFIQGRNIGSRYNDSSTVTKTENDQIISILKCIISFNYQSMKSVETELYGRDFFLFYINQNSYLIRDKNMYKKYIDNKTLSTIEKLSNDQRVLALIDSNIGYLAHNDFRPANIINANGIMKIIDWDLFGKGVKFHDIARFYNFYYSDQIFQDQYLNTWLHEKMTTEELILFYTWLTLESFHETNMVLRRFNENISKDNLNIIKNNFYKRINKLVTFTDILNQLLY